MPLWWAGAAAKATKTPKALVWIRLRYLAWKAGSSTVLLSNVWLEKQGVTRSIKYRALRELEEAGLILVERRPHKSPRVTIVAM
jgi:DNA-binding MarR family transcriptional regulator